MAEFNDAVDKGYSHAKCACCLETDRNSRETNAAGICEITGTDAEKTLIIYLNNTVWIIVYYIIYSLCT